MYLQIEIVREMISLQFYFRFNFHQFSHSFISLYHHYQFVLYIKSEKKNKITSSILLQKPYSPPPPQQIVHTKQFDHPCVPPRSSSFIQAIPQESRDVSNNRRNVAK